MDPYSIITLLLSFLVLLLVITKTIKPKPNSTPLPPGPWKLPIIGSTHHLLGALPHRAFSDLSKKFGPLMHLKIGEIDHIIISSREAAKEIMKNDLNFASRPDIVFLKPITYGATDIAFAPYGDYWRQLRKICTLELFSAKRVKSFASLREEEVSKLVSNISSSSTTERRRNSLINLSRAFLALTNSVVTRATYGDECRQQERFISTIEELSVLSSGFSIAELYPSIKFLDVVSGIKFKSERVHRNIDGVIDEIIREHQSKSRGDGKEECLLDVLLRIKEDGDLEIPLTMDNVKAVILDMFSAGTETSATLMDWTMVELMRNPKVMEKVQSETRQILKEKGHAAVEELKYLKLVIKEALRLHPPFPLLFPRVCASTCEVGGYRLEAGSRIIINDWALGRDPRYWDDPESFVPERFEDSELDYKGNSYEYLPFGAGRRICPGISFSQATVELALARLLFHFDWELPEGMEVQDLDMAEAFGASGRRKSDLLLIAKLHDAEAVQSDC